jgi:hypothetical protein
MNGIFSQERCHAYTIKLLRRERSAYGRIFTSILKVKSGSLKVSTVPDQTGDRELTISPGELTRLVAIVAEAIDVATAGVASSSTREPLREAA